jgi:maleylpyruvate isomerase
MTDHRRWMDTCTELFLGALDKLSDAEFDEPTALPGWSRRHLVAHVHLNAEALRNLIHWARTGEETPMYPSSEHRRADIEQGATLPPDRLRVLVRESAAALAADMDALPDDAWRAEVRTALGRPVPASEVPWMRVREAAVHAVDLAAGVGFADLPPEVTTALALDAIRKHATGPQAPALAAWLTGRATEAPELGPWL